MTEYFIASAKQCCDEFQILLQSNNYLSKKDIDKFLDKYIDIFNYLKKNKISLDKDYEKKINSIINNVYRIVEKRNNEFIKNKLIEHKDYFDNMFKDVDKNILLDEEQRKAIIIDEDYSLVIAGAGSGKTTTMVAKVKYLIEICHVNPEKIVLLAFTKKATEELNTRINIELKLNVEVLTFHKLGMQFIRKIFDRPVSIAGDGAIYEIVSNYVKEFIFPNKEMLKKFVDIFDKYVSFDDNIFKYKNFDEYYKFYVDNIYEEKKIDLDKYIDKRIESREKSNRTINGEYVKSKSEAKIADYLYINGYNYQYEKTYPYKLEQERSYIPDFTINYNETEVYVEYYGLAINSSNGKYSIEETNLYKKIIEKKKQLHKKYKTDLIELRPNYETGKDFLETLKNELNNRSVDCSKKTNKEIFYRLFYTNQESQYYKFILLCINFINSFKEIGYNNEDFDMLTDKIKDIKVKEQLEFIRPIYRYYNYQLHKKYKVDFNDMINYAYIGMEKAKDKYQHLDYDYLIIDEYQDISKQRYNFAKKLSDLFQAKIVAVGDDWQAIFGFSGSDVDLFTKFYNLMGYAEIITITYTYRNSQELIDLAGDFISKNEEQFTKKLLSSKHLNKPIEIHYYDIDKNNKIEILEEIIGKIYYTNKNHKILILGRYNSDIDLYIDSGIFYRTYGDEIICKKYPKASIDFMTVHKSKGLGYDQVILLNAINNKYGFPSQIEEEPLLKILDYDKVELIEYPEERRLFYVALTRTKNKVYILCPYLPFENRSYFINEINLNKNVLEIH